MSKERSCVEIVGYEHLHLHTDSLPPVELLLGAQKILALLTVMAQLKNMHLGL